MIRAVARSAGVLRGRRPLGLLVVATAGSSFGTLLAAIALAIDIKDKTESGTWVGVLLIADFLPAIAVGLLLGPLVDRLSRRRLMIGSDLVRAAAFVALPFVGSATAVVVLAGVVGLATGFFRPAVYAGLPNLVDEDDLPAANGLLQAVENLAWTLGPVLGGALVAVSSTDVAYGVNAATFLLSALLLAGIPARMLQSVTALTKGHWRDIADGIAVVARSRPLTLVLVTWSLAMLGMACVNVGQVFLAEDVFDAGSFGYGVLFGSIGLGLVIGSVAAGGALGDRPVATSYPIAIGLMGVGFAAAALAPSLWIAAACCVVAGVGNGTANVCNALLVQRGTSDDLRGRALTLVMSATYLALGVGMAAAGPLVDAVGARATWGTAAALFGVATVAGVAMARGMADPVADRVTERAPAV